MKINKIILDQNLNNQEEMFEFLSEQMEELGIVEDRKDYLKALHVREEESTTGLVDGFAIPHGKSSHIKESAIIYVRNKKGIEWNSLDGSLITDIFSLAIPESGNHLDDLIAISSSLMNPDVCLKLRQTNSEDEIKDIFK